MVSQHGLLCLATNVNHTTDSTAEDCLFLDVYAPSSATDTSKLPVYFFIQGGGYNSNSNANYNGAGLIKASHDNIVVVNFNYRVGPWGFLAGREVLAGGSVNNGVKDVIMALDWVKKYISKVCFPLRALIVVKYTLTCTPSLVVIPATSLSAASVQVPAL